MENKAFISLDERKCKLVIIQSRNGRYRILEEIENYYDLTTDIVKDCLFSPKAKNDILKIMQIYRYTIETFSASENMVATASNIIVKARNYRGFLDEIYTNTGMNFLIANSDDVVKDVYLSCTANIDASKGYIVDIRSYETYLMKFNRRNVIEYNLIPFGYSNLSNLDDFEEMVVTIKKELKKCSLVKNFEEDLVVGCGQAFIDVAKIAKKLTRYPIDIDNNYEMPSDCAEKVRDFVKDLDTQKIKKIKGLGPEGAESISGGLAIIYALFETLGVKSISVSTANKLQGIILSNLVGTANEKYSDLLQNSLDNYYEFKREGLAINSQVYDMALLLFKQLKVVHKLPRIYVKALKIAAYMFDCGKFIGFNNYQKNSFYTIMNADIAGASQKDILMAAFACSCQNLDNFNLPEILKYKEILTDEDIEAIRKLGVIVNLAVNLNASRKNIINDIVCDILGDSIIMKTVVSANPSFEIMQSMKVAGDFRKIFKKSLQII